MAGRGEKQLGEVIDEYIKQELRKKQPRTVQQYTDCLNRLIRPEIGAKKARAVTVQDVTSLHNKWEHRPYQANRALSVIGSLYKWAWGRGYVPQGMNPAKGITRFKEQTRERVLTSAELMRLGDALQEAETDGLPLIIDPAKKSKYVSKDRRNVINPYAVAAIRLLLFTGARVSEILNLKWDQVSFEHGLLLLPSSKTGKKEVILNAPAREILADLPRAGVYVIASSSAGTKEEKPRRDLKKPWAAISHRAGLNDVRIHDLRHHFATVGASGGKSLPIIGKLLGHTTPATTARYSHFQHDPVRQAAESIGADIAASLGQKKGPNADVPDIDEERRRRR